MLPAAPLSPLAGWSSFSTSARPPGRFGEYDNEHQWHNAYWWHQNYPDWFWAHHPDWASVNPQWRDEDGAAHVMDAYCPHMGAHLAVGGCVKGTRIVCPFHQWAFDAEGRNVDIPYAERTNATVRILSNGAEKIGEVVKLIRGNKGTRVRLKVVPTGKIQPAVIELTRRSSAVAASKAVQSLTAFSAQGGLVLVDRNPAEAELLALALSERAGRKVQIKVPQRGEQRKLARVREQDAVRRADLGGPPQPAGPGPLPALP